MSDELVFHDIHDGGRILFRQSWHDSGLSDHAASRQAHPLPDWYLLNDWSKCPIDELRERAQVLERILGPTPRFSMWADSNAMIIRLAAIKAELTRRETPCQEPDHVHEIR